MIASFAAPADSECLSPFDAQWELLPVSPAGPLNDKPVPVARPLTDKRRLTRRAPVSMPVTVWRKGVVTHARAVEMSTSGIAVAGAPRLNPGTEVTLYLKRSAEPPVKVCVRGVRVTLFGHQAFEFVELSDADRLAMAEVIDRELERYKKRWAECTEENVLFSTGCRN